MEWKIYNANGEERAIVKELELHDEWMAECYLTITVKSAEPVNFAIGDYIDYRGERYCINYDPTVLKKARRGTYGEGFTYDNIKFANDAQNKVVTCDFTDIVLNDNKLHYTSLPTFPFYCETVDDLLDRIQACLEELYPGEFVIIGLNTVRNEQRGQLVGREQAFVDAYKQYVDPQGYYNTKPYGKIGVALTADNISCWDAVTKIHEDFDLNFIQRGNVIVAGTTGTLTPSTFRYGKGKGLYELERICDSSKQIVTRLRAYGSENNIPSRYYATLNMQCFGTVTKIEANYATSGIHYAAFLLDLDFAARLFNNRSVSYPGSTENPNYIVEIRANDITVKGYVSKDYSSNNCYVYCEFTGTNPEDDRDETDESKMNAFSEAIKQGDTVYFVNYINKDAWPKDHSNYATENLPNNMAINRLMLPGFPNQSLYDWVKAHGGTDCDDATGQATISGFTGIFSKDKHRPWIQSMKAEEYGVRPASIYFDGSDETTDIHPTIEEMTYNGVRVDEILSADQITDNGVYDTDDPKNFTITLPNLGFELDKVYQDGASIDMKDGMCGARSFKMASRPKKNASGNWVCEVQRAYDDSLSLWFPYSDFQIRPNDHYVLIGIDMPDAYVDAAAEKLFGAAIEALQKNDKPTYTYQPRIDEIWMQRQHDSSIGTAITSIHDTIKAGDIFAFEDEDLGIDCSIIIDVLTIRENGNNGLPTYEVTLRDEKQVSAIQKMIDKAVSSNSVNSGNGGSGNGYNGRQVQSAIENYGSEYYISKVNDDTANGEIGFMKGLWIKFKGLFGFDAEGNLSANEGNFSGRVTANDMRSPNYTGDGIADTGWAITNDNGSGSSQAVFDYLTIRKKMIVNSLEIKETHVTAGDIAQTCASAEIARTDYFEVDDQGNYTLLGYAKKKIPWYLKGLAIVLGKDSSRSNFLRMLGHYKEIRVTLTAADLSRCNRIRCYFLAKDGEREIENWFRVNDLVRCQTWNVTNVTRQTYTPDFNDHAGNVFWWRKVTDVSWNTGTPQYFDPNGNKTTNEAEAYINEGGIARLASNGTYSATVDEAHAPKVLDGNTYHWIDVAYDYEAEQNAFRQGNDTGWCAKDSDIPALGDKVVQFGNSTDPDRMNITLSEVNGSGNIDAPDIKMYRGVYTFSLEKSWWGGVPCKMKLSPATGYEFFGPHFKFTTEYGEARVPFDRAEKYWTSIAFERDEYHEAAGYEYPSYSDDILDQNGSFVSRADGSSPKNYVRKCYYYDRLTHNGSLWLCSMANETWYWRATVAFSTYAQGDKVTNYESLPDDQKALCEHVRNYTNEEPSVASGDWTQQVDKGESMIRLAIDNEHEDFLFDGATLIAPSGGATSPIHLYYGREDVIAEATSLTVDSTTGTPTSGADRPYISDNILYIPTINAETAKVVIKAVYEGQSYYAEFTANRTTQDKYDIVVRPSSIAYNATTYASSSSYTTIQTINLSATGIGIGGTKLNPSLSASVGAGKLCVFWAYVSSNGSIGSFSSYPVTSKAVTKSECESYAGIYFELRYYTSSSEYRICDYETVEIAKTEDGVKGDKGDKGDQGDKGNNGENGKDGWMVTADPANVIITQNLDTQNSFTTATVSFTAKKGNASATITSIGTPSWVHFTGSRNSSNKTITVTAPTKDSSGDYYSEGSFTVNVNVTDPDGGGTITFSVTVFCYANLLGTWKQSVENGTETIIANKVTYDYVNGVLTKDGRNYDSIRNAAIANETWKSNKESIYDGYSTSISNLNTQVNTAEQSLSSLQTTVNGHTTSISEISQKADNISLKLTNLEDDIEETGIDITHGTIDLIAGKVNFKASNGTSVNPYMSIGQDGKLTVDSITATNGSFKGTMTTIDETVNTFTNQGSTTDYYAKRGVEIKYNKNRSSVAQLISTEWGNGASGMLSLETRKTSNDGLNSTTNIYPGSINLYSGTTADVSTETVQITHDSYGGYIWLANKSLAGGANLTIKGNGSILGDIAFPNCIKTSSFTLPANPLDGMIFFCKGISSALTITTRGHAIMERNGNGNWCGAYSSETISDRDSVILVFSGTAGKWLYFSCE